MTTVVTGFHFGHSITWNGTTGTWHYDDTGENIKEVPWRKCPRCNLPPTEDGHDACIANLPGVKNACCGHGRKGWGYVVFDDNRTYTIDGMELDNNDGHHKAVEYIED